MHLKFSTIHTTYATTVHNKGENCTHLNDTDRKTSNDTFWKQ